MERKFGKKNTIKIDPLAYNLAIIGESGIGKTTIAKEICETLAGEDGYLILNIGKEDGVDAIEDAMYEDAPDWKTFNAIVTDIVKNRTTAYKDLRVIVYDTMDELFKIAEPEVVRLHNAEHPDKQVSSIKAAFGGFQAGEEKAIEIILDKIWALKKVGISMFYIGHTKRRTLTDIVTGLEYEMLTTNMSNKYFNAIKTKLHVLGVASINRKIETKRVKQKIGADKSIGKVVDESRIITFRDDNFNIDSKSRFAEIVPEISFSKDEFIEAVNEAIKAARKKKSNDDTSLEEELKQERLEKEEQIEKVVAQEQSKLIDTDQNERLTEEIKSKFPTASAEVKSIVKDIMEEFNIKSFKDTSKVSTAALERIVEVLG